MDEKIALFSNTAFPIAQIHGE